MFFHVTFLLKFLVANFLRYSLTFKNLITTYVKGTSVLSIFSQA